MNSWQIRERDCAVDPPRFSVTGDWRDRPHRRSGVSEAGYSSSIAHITQLSIVPYLNRA
ncbi:hypothetical protein [Microcoleus sp. Pol17_C1]|uniref:hypothetical protein n=1 Tax=unclassified Microcoleus TaxID=2642155 RepID=UPI002FD3A69B